MAAVGSVNRPSQDTRQGARRAEGGRSFDRIEADLSLPTRSAVEDFGRIRASHPDLDAMSGLGDPHNSVLIRQEAPLRPSGVGPRRSLADTPPSAPIRLVGAVRSVERPVHGRAGLDVALRSGPIRHCRHRTLPRPFRASRVRRLRSWIGCYGRRLRQPVG